MAAVNAIEPAQVSPATQASSTQASAQAQMQALGLPPAPLSAAASANTLNASLVTSQWGIDPGSVAGVYGGAAAQSSNLFTSDSLLPVLTTISRANAEQSLSLLGIKTITPGSGEATAKSAAEIARQAAAEQPYLASGVSVIDPLWGRNA